MAQAAALGLGLGTASMCHRMYYKASSLQSSPKTTTNFFPSWNSTDQQLKDVRMERQMALDGRTQARSRDTTLRTPGL